MPYGKAFTRGKQNNGKNRVNQNDSFDNCFSAVSDAGPLHSDDTNIKTGAGYQTAKTGAITNNVFYNPFGSFGNKPANEEGAGSGSSNFNLHEEQSGEQGDEQQGTSVLEPAFGGGMRNENARNNNIYFRTNQAQKDNNLLAFNPFAQQHSSQSFVQHQTMPATQDDRFKMLGIQKLPAKKKNLSLLDGSTAVEMYFNTAQNGQKDKQDENPKQAKQFQPLYTKLLTSGKGVI